MQRALGPQGGEGLLFQVKFLRPGQVPHQEGCDNREHSTEHLARDTGDGERGGVESGRLGSEVS